MLPNYSNVPVINHSVSVKQHVQFQEPEIKATKLNADIQPTIHYTCPTPSVTCQKNVCEKRLFNIDLKLSVKPFHSHICAAKLFKCAKLYQI